tara:strand:- start:174 stop:383 length:210 start_codon:yes stop_codon:yes gene_type:complete
MKMKGYKKDMSYAKDMNDKYKSKGMNLKDNTQAGNVRNISIPEGQGWGEVKEYHGGNQGYPAEAFSYQY